MIRAARLATLLLLLLTAAACRDEPLVGVAMPELPLQRLDGATETLADYRGKVVVLNLWATWCLPCRAEMPSLQRLADALPADRFAVLGVAVDTEPVLVRAYLRENGLGFARHVDAGGKGTAQRLLAMAFPTTLIFDPGGVLRQRVLGARDWSDPAVRHELEKIRLDFQKG